MHHRHWRVTRHSSRGRSPARRDALPSPSFRPDPGAPAPAGRPVRTRPRSIRNEEHAGGDGVQAIAGESARKYNRP